MTAANLSLFDPVEVELGKAREDLIEDCISLEENISDLSSLDDDLSQLKEKGQGMKKRSHRLEKQMRCMSMSCTIILIVLVLASVGAGIYLLVEKNHR